jgi:ABC-2 type transport system ATP-binding protein
MTADVMIQASDLTKRFGSVRALDKISFEVEKGEVVGFLGPNGAGKSTTMRILTCFLAPTSGTAKVCGVDVFDDPLEVRRNLGYLPQRAPLLESIIEVCGLAQVLEKDISALSHGFRQRVGLGQALLHNPQILVLDEPTADLDPNEKAEVIRYIKEIGKDRTVLLSTHNLSEVEEACARAIIVSKGKVVADGPLEEIRSKTGSVRYVVTVDERQGLPGKSAPKVAELRAALERIQGALRSRELPTDEKVHKVELSGVKDSDLRAEIFQLMVAQGWLMLELRRDAQSLDAVFRDLTRGDEAMDRGLAFDEADEPDDQSEEDDGESDEDEGSDDDASDDAAAESQEKKDA